MEFLSISKSLNRQENVLILSIHFKSSENLSNVFRCFQIETFQNLAHRPINRRLKNILKYTKILKIWNLPRGTYCMLSVHIEYQDKNTTNKQKAILQTKFLFPSLLIRLRVDSHLKSSSLKEREKNPVPDGRVVSISESNRLPGRGELSAAVTSSVQ